MRSHFLIASGFLALALGFAQLASAAVVGYWTFDSNQTNQVPTGLGAAVTISGAPQAGWSGGAIGPIPGSEGGSGVRPGGIVGNGVNFIDANNDRLQLPVTTANLGNTFTISAWYYLSPLDNNTASPQRFYVFEAANNYDVSYGTGSGSTYDSYLGQTHAGAVNTPTNQWHNVVHSVTTSGANSILTVYVNGVQQGTPLSVATSSVSWLTGINLGTARNTAERDFDGVIDEVAIWNNALNATQAQWVYQQGLAGKSLTAIEPGVNAARVAISSSNVYTVTNESAGFEGVSFQSPNTGDHQLHVNPIGARLLQRDGVIIANPNQIGHPNGDEHYVAVGGDLTELSTDARYNNGMAFVTMDATSQAAERNFNVSFGSFQFEDGWVGGHVDGISTTPAFFTTNTNTLPAGSTINRLSDGQYILHLEGVDSRTDGMLFVVGGENTDNLIFAGAIRNANNVNVLNSNAQLGDWHISNLDDGFNDVAGTGQNGNWSFVYVPYIRNVDGTFIQNLIGGEILDSGDGAAATIGNHSGTFTLTDLTSPNGTYQIQIPNPAGGFYTDQDGILILSTSSILEDETGDPVDGNFLNWVFDPGLQAFIIQARDMPGPTASLQDFNGSGGFYFAFLPYENSLLLVTPEPSSWAIFAVVALIALAGAWRRGRK